MNENFYRGKLPHYQPPDGTFFVTYSLFGAIPRSILNKLREDYKVAISLIEKDGARSEEKVDMALSEDFRKKLDSILRKKEYNEQKRYFKRVDDFLESNINGPHWLKIPAIAAVNSDALHFYDGKHYTLWAFCIMSNHVHALFSLSEGAPELWKVIQNIKKYTAKEGNKILGRNNERFWERESYDHLVREREYEFNRILAYILNNPVKAGMVEDWSRYEWSYCNPNLL